jgi:hypothetical protein
MGYSPSLAARRTLVYGYGSSVTTISSPSSGQPFQAIDQLVHAGAADASGEGITFVSDTLQGRSYSNAINPQFRSILHLDMVMDMNTQGSVNHNDYATYYALTSTVNYVGVARQFEVTSTFYDGSNKSLLTVTDGATCTRLEPGERMGYLFQSASSVSNDMVVPYSRLYGWSSISS